MKEPRRLLQVTTSALERELLQSGIVESPSAPSLERTLVRVAEGLGAGHDKRRSRGPFSVARIRGEQRGNAPQARAWVWWLLLAVVSFVSGTAGSLAWG